MESLNHALNLQKFSISLLLLVFSVIFASTINGQVTTIFNEDWEGTWTTDWHVDAGTWQVGTPTSGPGSAYEGNKCAATVLDGSYARTVNSRLIRHTTFLVPLVSENPRLRFWHWYSFGSDDYGEVQISSDNGSTWETISPKYTSTGSGVWTYPIIDLSAYAGLTVQIAFYHYATGYYTSSGWYIDDIAVLSGPLVFNDQENFESGLGDWYADKGTWEVGEPTSGPGSSYSSPNCAATVLDGSYAQTVRSRFISPPFVVATVSENPALRFWHWYSFGSDDYGEVNIRVNNGSWAPISDQFTSTSSGAWTNYYISLAAYADSTVQIAFYHYATGYYTSSGWYIDDIMIDGDGVAEAVWPGDTENDGDVDQADVLPIGFNWGTIGIKRSTISMEWRKHVCLSWEPLSNTYIDCNGDGTIDEADVLAVGLNWGKTHTLLGANRGNNAIAKQNFESQISLSVIENGSEDITLGLKYEASEGSSALRGLSFKLAYGSGIELVTIKEGAYLGTELLSYQHSETSSEAYAIVSKVAEEVESESSIAKIKIMFQDGYTSETIEILEVEGIDVNGKKIFVEGIIEKIDLLTGIEDKKLSVKEFKLHQNYPNPFNPTTTISYSIPQDSHVKLCVYNVLGEEVAMLVNGRKSAGTYKLQFNASKLTSGVYIYKITTDKNSEVKKLILMK